MNLEGLPLWLDILAAGLLLLGGVSAVIGALALVRLPTSVERLHGPTLIASVGGGLVILATTLLALFTDTALRLAPLLVMGLFLFTTPIVGQALTRALRRELGSDPNRDRNRDASPTVSAAHSPVPAPQSSEAP